ncbi:MAG: hypothetical protein JSU97_07380 [Dehalococcoidia bacterium]|nr:MAG: hypothetical protein JSU97_07380 [Dehalococcoidia bacterium]
MRMLRTILLPIGLIALVVLIASLIPDRAWADGCGPGLHWVDDCPAGDDLFSSTTAVVGIDLNGDDCETVELDLTLSGPTTVHRDAEAGDQIDTEIVTMELTGGGVTLRVGNVPGINPDVPPTIGAVVEHPTIWTLADSFFDVFFEVDVPGVGLLYNHDPVRVEAVIDRVPPWNTIYLPPGDVCVDLFDDPIDGNDTGMNLAHAEHDTGPPPGGGAVELFVDSSEPSAHAEDASGSSSPPYAAMAVIAAAAVVALAAGGWYARRRLS